MDRLPVAIALTALSSISWGQSGGTGRENPDSGIPYESGDNSSAVVHQERWSDFLPIFGKQAREQGYVLPRPFGISLGYMGQKQPFDVNGLEVEGQDVKSSGLAVVDEVDNQEDTVTLRFDAWLFPFLNLYGILGKTRGEAEGPLTVNLGAIPQLTGLCKLPITNCVINTTFDIEYEGNVGGGGLTIAGGYKDFFGMIDTNYTVTDLDISRTDATAWVTSARIGWNGQLNWFKGAFWLGAMHQNISQVLDLEIPTDVLDKGFLEVSVDQSTQVPWNTVVGGRWEFGKGFEMLAEFGFGGRRSNMVNFTYRF